MAEKYLIGIIQVPLCAFRAEVGVGRDEDEKLVTRLSRVFERTPCRPEIWENHVKGLVDWSTITNILSTLGLSYRKLRDTVHWAKYPKAYLRDSIICIDGNQRIGAARRLSGENSWWTVRLYCVSQDYRGDLINTITWDFSHQAVRCDGDIYREIRRLQQAGLFSGAQKLRAHLTPCKEKILQLLMKKERLVDALDELLPLRGLWHGLQLGNMHKYIALHYDEQIEHGVNHVTEIWKHITDDDPELKEYVDVDTVRGLELLAPWRKADAILIRTRMERKLIFPLVSDASKRNYLLQRILELRTIVPSIMTFHENMKYFSIGAKILKKFLVGDKAILVRREDGKDRTVQGYLEHYWRRSQSVLIQVDHKRYQTVLQPSFLLVLREIFLFALRNFPFLSTEHPKQDQRGETMPAVVDEGYIAHLYERARQLGLLTPEVIKSPMRDLSKVQLPSFSASKSHPSRWNCGRPPLRSYLEVHQHAFLLAFENTRFEERLTPMLVQSDFMKAFFGHEEIITEGDAAVLNHVTYELGQPINRKDVNTGRNKKTRRGVTGEATSRLKQQTARTKAWALPKGVVPTLARLRPTKLPKPVELSGVQQQAARTSPMLELQTGTNHTHKETLKRRTRPASPQNEAAIRPHDQFNRLIKRQRLLPPLPPSPKEKAAKAQRSLAQTSSQGSQVRERTTRTPPPAQEAATTIALDEPIRTRRQAQRFVIQEPNESPPPGVTKPHRGRSPVGHQLASASPMSSSQKEVIALGEATELKRQPQRRSAIQTPDESPPPGVTQTFRKRSALWSPTTQPNQVIETFAESRCYPGEAGPDTLFHRGQNGEESEEEL